MRHCRGVTGERFRTAQAYRQLGDLERVQETEGLGLAALQIERKGRSRAGAMAVVDIRLARAFLKKAEIADELDLGMTAQPSADLGGIFARAGHAQFERFE